MKKCYRFFFVSTTFKKSKIKQICKYLAKYRLKFLMNFNEILISKYSLNASNNYKSESKHPVKCGEESIFNLDFDLSQFNFKIDFKY